MRSKTMKALLGILIVLLWLPVQAAESLVPLESVSVDVSDLESVRRGAAHFVNYCMGCHSIKHLRYSRIGQDLELSEDELRKDVMVEDAKIHDSLISAMAKADAVKWLGIDPPDLSLVARARGDDWLYSYLKGFYVDPTRPNGVNNVVFKDVGMPNVFWDMQGEQKPIHSKLNGADVISGLELATPGKLTEKQFEALLTDLVAFMVYAGEPSQAQRVSLGKYVILVLIGFAVLLYKLKKEYWKDID